MKQIILWTLIWYASSISLTAANKHLFSIMGFNYPFFVTFAHFTIIAGVLHIAFSSSIYCFNKFGIIPTRPTISHNNFFKVFLPIGFLTAAEISLTNAAFAFATISLITVIKSTLVMVTYILSVAIGLEKLRIRLLLTVLGIVASVIATVPSLEITSWFGVLVTCLAVLCAAARWVVIHLQFTAKDYTPLQFLLLTQPLASLCLIPGVVIVDLRRLIAFQAATSDPQLLLAAAYIIIASVILAFLVINAEFQLVHATSSVTLTVIGVGKELATITMSCIVFREKMGILPACGILTSVCGIVLYSILRYRISSNKSSSIRAQQNIITTPESIEGDCTMVNINRPAVLTTAVGSPISFLDGPLSDSDDDDHQTAFKRQLSPSTKEHSTLSPISTA